MIVSGDALENIDRRTFPEESKHISGSSCVVSKCEGFVHRLYMLWYVKLPRCNLISIDFQDERNRREWIKNCF